MTGRILVWLLALLLVVAPVKASQNSLSSPTTGTVSGLQLTNNYNNALDSLNTMNSGASAPTNQLSATPSAGNSWLNTTATPYPREVYDGTNWLTPYWLDATNHYTLVKIGGGAATVASAATTDICTSIPQSYVTISGTTTITSLGSGCNTGHVKFVTFSGILTLTYNASSLIIPGAASVTTAAGDQAVVVSLGSGNWQVASYTPATGTALVNQAVPVGSSFSFLGTTAPSSNYLLGYGQAVSRSTYSALKTAITSVQSATSTSTSPTVTGLTDTSNFGYGMAIEMTGFTSGTTILSCTSTTCTLSNNASASATNNLTVYFYGNGDGSTTFNLPDCRGKAITYRDNTGGTAANVAQASTTITTNGTTAATVGSAAGVAKGMYVISANVVPGTTVSAINGTAVTLSQAASGSASGTAARFSSTIDAQALGSTGGAPTHVQTAQELVQHTHTDSGHTHTITFPTATYATTGGGTLYGNGAGAFGTFPSGTNSGTANIQNTGNSAAMLVQSPALVLNCLVRVSRLAPRHDVPRRAASGPLVALGRMAA